MARKYYYRRRRYYGKPSYVRDVRILNSAAWSNTSISTAKALTMRVVYNPENDRVNPGSIKTVKHLEVQVNTVPYWRYYAGQQTVTGVPPLGWVMVYVPQGEMPHLPLGADNSLQNNPLYEPEQFILGHGTLLQGQRIQEPNVTDDARYPMVTSGGNNMRIKCPLSKKLNPGDAIWLIVYTLHLPGVPDLSLTEFTGVVSYAIKDNLLVCLS